MRTKIGFAMSLLIMAIMLSGCQTAPMTAKSRLSVSGLITVTNLTVTITTGTNGVCTTNVVQHIVNKSPSAGDLEIKEAELHGRTKVGVAEATHGFGSGFFTPTYNGGGG